MSGLSEYQQQYLAYRKVKVEEVQRKYQLDLKLYEQQMYNNAKIFEDYVRFQFGQSNGKQLKRRFHQNQQDLSNIYDWMRTNSTRK